VIFGPTDVRRTPLPSRRFQTLFIRLRAWRWVPRLHRAFVATRRASVGRVGVNHVFSALLRDTADVIGEPYQHPVFAPSRTGMTDSSSPALPPMTILSRGAALAGRGRHTCNALPDHRYNAGEF